MKIWLIENWFKLAGIIVILTIGLAYINYLNTKENNQRKVEEEKSVQSKLESELKAEAENKKYLADRKTDCLQIYTTEDENGIMFEDGDLMKRMMPVT